MKVDAEQVLCRFQLSNLTRHGHHALHEWIVTEARREGVQGATVLRGFYGMGADGEILELRTWSLLQERPVIVEVIDERARIDDLLARVEPVFTRGVITLERAHVLLYRTAAHEKRSATAGTNVVSTVHASAASGVRTMKMAENGVLLRVFIGENDRDPVDGGTLYRAIVRRAHDARLAGATVLRGVVGYGRHARIHSAKWLETAIDLPLVIEIVDVEEKVEAFLPTLDAVIGEGLVTLEAVRIVKYSAQGRDDAPAQQS
jgi:PII-like signaling protein